MMLALLIAASAPSLTAELQPLSFLVGHCWRGEFASRKHVDTHCFEPVFGGKFVRDRHEVTGGETIYRGETIYGWNAETRRVEYTYWSSGGGVSRGSMVPKDGALDFGDQSHTRADGSTLTINTVWEPAAGADAYDVVSIRNGVTGADVVTYRRTD